MFQLLDGREHFYQWDIDRKIIVLDDDITEVHFCNRTDDCSLVCEVKEINGVRVADVPNILLQEDLRINVYAYDGNYTKHSQCFKVARRTRPTDYVYTETEIKRYGDLEERISALEENGIPSDVDLTGYATKDYVDDRTNDLLVATKEYVNFKTEGYATESYVDDTANELETVLRDILEAIQSGESASIVIEEIEQLLISYFETKTVEEVEE